MNLICPASPCLNDNICQRLIIRSISVRQKRMAKYTNTINDVMHLDCKLLIKSMKSVLIFFKEAIIE